MTKPSIRTFSPIFVALILFTALLVTYNPTFATTAPKHTVSVTLLISPSSVSGGGTYSVSGTLTDTTTGTPLSSKKITFIATSPITIPNTTTDSDGKYLVSGLKAPNTAGSYSIQAKFNGGALYRTYSSTKTLSVTASSPLPSPATPPQPPTGLTAITASSSQINLSWTASADNGGFAISGYNVYRSTTAGGEGTTPITTVSGTTYTDTGLTNGQAYYYIVKAVNSLGTSSASNEASATPAALATVPSAPTGLAASAISISQINLSWTAPINNGGSSIIGYKIERSTDGGTVWSTISSNTGSTSTTYSDSGLAASTTYTYQVSAINGIGTSSPSSTVSATTPSSAPPPTTNKFFLALFLQYVDPTSQVNIYQPNMDSADMTRLRASGGTLSPSYVTAAMGLPGLHGADYISSADIVTNALAVKKAGFDFIEFNLESGLSPASDSADVVKAMQTAANAAHAVGLKFRATPSKAYTTAYGSQIAPFADYYHMQAQSQQTTCGTSNDNFKSFVDTEVPILRAANPNLVISVQESASQGAAPGLTVTQTMEKCFSEVANEVDGTSIWFGSSTISDLQAFVQWFHANYN
jgi:hypothetical protein